MKFLLKFIPKVIPVVVLGILVLLGMRVLKRQLRENRYYEPKRVNFYLLITLLVFAIVGLFGLGQITDFANAFLGLQVLVLVLGVVHAWLLFATHEWADRLSFTAETLYTVIVSLVGTMGLVGSFMLASSLAMPENLGMELEFAKSMLGFPIPYLIVRTYDYLLQVPGKKVNNWTFAHAEKPVLNLDDGNVIFIYLNLLKDISTGESSRINQRTRFPMDSTFSEFFQHFVDDYNEHFPHEPIKDLDTFENGGKVGWVFYLVKGTRNKKTYIDPEEKGKGPIAEGDSVYIERVGIDKKPPRKKKSQNKPKSNKRREGLFKSKKKPESKIKIKKRV